MIDKGTADAATLAIAVLGAALGVLNFWRSWSGDRVRVRVHVAHGKVLPGSQKHGLTVEVLNLSTFPITITHIGLDLLGTGEHIQLVRPQFVHGQSLPARLESRAAFTVWQPLSAFEDEQLAVLRNAYVLTACGRKVKSARVVFRELNAMAAAAADSPPPN